MSFQSVLITGANRGLGLEFVRQILASTSPPKHLITTARQTSNEELDELKASNSCLHILQLDTKKYDQFDEFAAKVKQIVGDDGVDTLINNAGIQLKATLEEVTPQAMIENFEVNTVAPLMLTKSLLPLLKTAASQRKTVVVNMSTMLASITLHNYEEGKPRIADRYPYRTSKTALNMVTKCLHNDLNEFGILVIAQQPGHVKTDLGGPLAQMEPSVSIANMLNTFKNLSKDQSGKLINFDGTVLPY